MNILIVGNVLKDVYLDLDNRTENLETDQHGTEWLNLAFNASEHHFFNRNSNFGGAAVSLEVFQKMGISSSISDSDFNLSDNNPTIDTSSSAYRYILIANNNVTYFAPSKFKTTNFSPPAESVDYLYVDRSADININAAKKINAYLDISAKTKLILYIRNFNNPNLNSLINRADLLFIENNKQSPKASYAPELAEIPPEKIIFISEKQLSCLGITENVSTGNIDVLTHLSAYSIASATVLGCFILGFSIEDSFRMARINAEQTRLNSSLSLSELQKIASNFHPTDELELIAANLLLKNKGILAADESGGSISKKFAQLNIPDTYENRRDYRNIFFTTPNLEKYVNGVILFDETTRQLADNGQNFVDFLTGKRIIPGIKVDQGLEKFADSTSANSEETWTKGLDGLSNRLKEYHSMGLRFAKWRAAFEIRLDEQGNILTPTDYAIKENCHILAKYARECQDAHIVPIVEPELVYDGNYDIDKSASITSRILDQLFQQLSNHQVNLRACILKVNMILAGKKYEIQSTPEEVGTKTAEVLKSHVPKNLAGIVFLSGGQTVEQATDNLAAIVANGPFPWPVTFSFARALQDPALYAWKGNGANTDAARSAFLSRLIANTEALEKSNN